MKKDYEELIKLIKKAQGNKTLNQFALGAGINAGHLSRILNGNFKNPPSPDTLKKIAKNSHNEVSYEELLKASGYIDEADLTYEEIIKDDEIYSKFSHLLENENAKVLFDKLGELNEDEFKQFIDIATIIKKEDKGKK